jgi:cytochrome bd-type quinol oxidase subunit 2
MDQTAFYGVVAATNFTLLGLWWVAVKDRDDLTGRDGRGGNMAYLVSLQFVIPAAVSLFAQVAPEITAVWRIGFSIAGLIGAVGIALLAMRFRTHTDAKVMPWVLGGAGVPLYVLVFVVALFPDVVDAMNLSLSPIEVEGLLLSIIVVLGVQEAWFVSMTPSRPSPSDNGAEEASPTGTTVPGAAATGR